MSVASAGFRRRAAGLLTLEGLAAATPLLAIVASFAFLYAAEAVAHTTPILFTDELEWTQISRGVAEDGLPSIRGERVALESLYVYLIAPAWWLGDTASAYELVKFLNVLVMSAAAIPAYLLARRLVSKPAALAVAAASIAIPPMVYALYVITEPLAYPWAVLCAWLIVEALAVRTRGWVAAAVAASLVAPFVRGQLVVIPLGFAAAAFLLWWRSERALRLRRPAWVRADTIGLALLAVGAFVVLSRWLLHSNNQWRLATDLPNSVGLHVLWAIGALAIGLGVLPLVAGLTALAPGRGERLSPYDRAFVAVTLSFVALFSAYTGIKGAYNEVTFANRIDERNVFYLAPLLLAGTAIVLERRRWRVLPFLAATGLAAYLVVATPIQLDYPYFDAPGFSIATMTNRELFWTRSDIELALIVALVVSVAIVLAARVVPRGALAAVAVLVVAWNVAGQVTAAGGANASARSYAGGLPQPLDWVDEETGGASVTYLGQALTSGDQLRTNLIEFWNPSIERVYTTDRSLIFPGPTVFAELIRTDGTLSNPPGTEYVLADSGVVPVGEPVARRGELRLYRLDGPAIRLRESLFGVDGEAWMGMAGAYNRFAEGSGGEVAVSMSRTAFCPPPETAPPPPRATVRVGSLVRGLGDDRLPRLEEVWTERSIVVPNCEQRELRLPVRSTPWRVEVVADRTFKPADYGIPDTRVLSLMVGFRHIP